MVVAYRITHNEGVIEGILTKPGDGVPLYDLYEVDGTLMAFETEDEAEAWLAARRYP